jgi:hypothetical protein
MMEISIISKIGVVLIMVGFLLPIYTANLFPPSKKIKEKYDEMINKGEPEGKTGWLISFKIDELIRKTWIYIFNPNPA